MGNKIGRSYDDDLIEDLRDPDEALAYLNAALEDTEQQEVFLSALGHVAKAWGMTEVARRSNLNRENLYSMLSKTGNPELSSLSAILNALGLKLSVEKKAS